MKRIASYATARQPEGVAVTVTAAPAAAAVTVTAAAAVMVTVTAAVTVTVSRHVVVCVGCRRGRHIDCTPPVRSPPLASDAGGVREVSRPRGITQLI